MNVEVAHVYDDESVALPLDPKLNARVGDVHRAHVCDHVLVLRACVHGHESHSNEDKRRFP